jgi:hypothetical protein
VGSAACSQAGGFPVEDGAAEADRDTGGTDPETGRQSGRPEGSGSSSAERGFYRRFEIARDVAVIVLALVACYLHVTRFTTYAFEDAYITFRYAENLAAGEGFVFNPGERVLGTSTPLFTMLLAVMRVFGCDIAATAGLVYSVCLSLTALAGAWILRRFGHPNLGALFAVLVLWGVGRGLHFHGMETTLYTLLMLGALILAFGDRPVIAGLVTGFACLTRYDGVVFAIALLAFMWIRSRSMPWRAAIAIAAVTAPWFLFSWVYFGSLLPNTLGAKSSAVHSIEYMHVSLVRLIDSFFSPVARFTRPGEFPAILRAALVLLLVAPVFSQTRIKLRQEPLTGTLLAFPVLLWLGYSVIAPPVAFRWYLVPGMLLLLVFCLLCWGEALSGVRRHWRTVFTVAAIALVLCGLWLLPSGVEAEVDTLIANAVYQRRVPAYRLLANWIRDHDLADLKLLTREPGYLGYATANPIVDAAGLVTEDVYFHKSEDRQSSVVEIIDEHRPDLLVFAAAGWPLIRHPDFIPLYHTMPVKSLYVRLEAFQKRLPTLARTWLEPTGYHPVEIDTRSHPISFDFDDGETGGWWSSAEFPEFIGRPIELGLDGVPPSGSYLHTRRANSAGSLVSPPFLIDFDELDFAFASNHPRARAELIVNGLPVLSVSGRPGALSRFVEIRWPVSSWRGQVAILRLHDDARASGFLAADRLRSVRGRDLVLFDDFEGGGYSERWQSGFGDAPSSFAEYARRYGPQLIQGRYSAVSLPWSGVQELRSRPFTVERERMAFVVFDFADRNSSVELEIDGESVYRVECTRSNRLVPVVWDLSSFRGRRAVLSVVDGGRSRARWIGIDQIVMYDVDARDDGSEGS